METALPFTTVDKRTRGGCCSQGPAAIWDRISFQNERSGILTDRTGPLSRRFADNKERASMIIWAGFSAAGKPKLGVQQSKARGNLIRADTLRSRIDLKVPSVARRKRIIEL
ncbi:hypothetical protein PsorP6_006710 [Peronosclerospora sorghi]|uniref:Uncharacterized protein n=1 Tax=Peronosclerospora sorghi TaxID=230839 RepID=A0ACC0W4H9_9STRA|nr:hypothetical protein PsorP6_006710 [Peronosclerospora sorghi]